MKPLVKKVVSGGQTGVDRAGLDAAIELGLQTGGWVPKGRRAEDGIIHDRYDTLTETRSTNYAERTELNVRDSDATVIISRGPLTGGSLLTRKLAERLRRPVLHLDLEELTVPAAARQLRVWLSVSGCSTLNVAGPRASSDPEVYRLVRLVLAGALSPTD